ncbi:5'-nucleotidase C-terminal domain-containing protein [Marinitoga sp. 1155]|uniref:5'-nucleotidase C-terminal domain-containing protein n=1 Tax=Marinitoga sp. 1155 TaxID=1428448 RepID=UPI000641688C|nr:5'-nucleotidase C-terminal domain-containing protein [Marinitoga sp. 1155]KLO22905.1 2', 3'-cyclic nucleotide 2'-phosphodiesterase [Marinitoga sp. 1155]
MRKFLILLSILIISLAIFAEEVNLVILHTSDLHGNIFPVNYATNKPYYVGLGRVSTFYKMEKEKNPNVFLIDTGDLIQGTPLEYYHARIDNGPVDPMVKVMNHMGYLASIIGNHEFNYGKKVLNKAISEATFPFLSANIVDRDTGKPVFKPYMVFDYKGIKIGILGLTTKFIPNWEDPKNIRNLDFYDPVEVAKKYVKILREKEKVDVLIVGYHGGFERDLNTGKPTEELTGENQGYQLLTEVPGIDVLLTGHQHRAISGVYNGVAVSMPKNWGKMVGRIELTLDNSNGKWKIVSKKSELLNSKTVESDKEVLALVQDYEDKVQKWLDQPVGTAKGDFYVYDPLKTRLADNALIEFVNRVQQTYSGVKISSTALFNNDIKGWKSGPVTLRDINGVYIYPNTLKVLKVTGKDIKDAIERSADYFVLKDGKVEVNKSWVDPKPQHYNYDMWEGIRYIIDVNKSVGERVVWLEYEGKPVEMNKEYEIVLNNYRAGGGGGYSMFKGKPVVKEVMMEVSELMADYIMEHKVIEAKVDNNWYVATDIMYNVKSGDTLFKLGRMYNVNPYAIAKWNNIKNPDLIYIGQKLVIYKPAISNN